MGYHMYQCNCDFFMKKEDKATALKAIQALDPDSGRGGRFEPETGKTESWFSWINTDEYKNATTLEEAVIAWRWELQGAVGGDVTSIYFDGEKLGDDEHLLRAIAPFVRDGSWIEIEGEDERWRWCFHGGELHTITPTVIWPEVGQEGEGNDQTT